MSYKYDIDYWCKMLRHNCTNSQKISEIRWNFVKKSEPKIVLDFGCGIGAFKAFAPNGIIVDTYDVSSWPQTGIKHEEYDLITFWDVLEHVDWINNPDKKIFDIFNKTKYIACTVPVIPDGKKIEEWKHYKPEEHLTYFSPQTLGEFMEKNGFVMVKCGYPEVDCGIREDIFSALFKKI